MRRIVRLNHTQIEQYSQIVAHAFPEFHLSKPEARDKLVQRLKMYQDIDEHVSLLGLLEDDTLLGGIRVHRFLHNYYGNMVPASGLGLVAVDLAHKKRGVCRDMMLHFLRSGRERGALFAMLYPFRPDFYHQMGFGWGARMHGYCVQPSQLPSSPHLTRAELMGEEHTEALKACYEEYFRQQHGMVGIDGWEWQRFIISDRLVVGVRQGERVTGYLSMQFRVVPGDTHDKDLHVEQAVWLDTSSMLSLLHFLRAQADQVRHIVMPLVDDAFSYLLADPRHTDRQLTTPLYHQNARTAIGHMVRLLNTQEAVLRRPWGEEDITVRFEVEDDFLAPNNEPFTVRFAGGTPYLEATATPDVTLRCRAVEFAPLLLNAVSLPKLAALGLVQLSDPGQLPRLTSLFRRDETPVCLAMF